ncbi:hypothetical protein LSUE1_G004048 [Lachnellula suecica]|uniref:Uncharacterized protein n=1 Tax=Lachnellula suecica TaxID=602035 RepID=A0A8T9CI23_9HELO|nr:hypothetical protein LSUE1_G004048 [Lachnellula suecica]
MQFTTTILSLALSAICLFNQVTGAAVSSPSPFDDKDITWTKPIFKGVLNGHAYEIEGTVTEVIAELEARHPGALAARTAAQSSLPNEVLRPRNKDGIICAPVPGQDFGWADTPSIKTGIQLLSSWVGDRFYIGGGPGNCGVVYCSNHAAIAVCNDRPEPIWPACQYVATYAQDIVDRCTDWPRGRTGGQEFDTDRYNIVIGRC